MTINIVLTSYPRRITNCVPVINSVLENTLVPDRIYLTLSHLEFPNYERDLPTNLHRLIMTSNKVILNWVEDNYKSMKKLFPVLPYLEDEDVIIDIDDDMILPKDFIESRVKDFKEYGCKYPITSNLNKTMNIDSLVVSAYSLFQKKMLNGYEKFVTKEILNTFNDDRTYLYLCHMNGYKLKPCTKYSVNKVDGIQQLDVPPHSGYSYAIGNRYDEIADGVVKQMSNGRSINECFNLFNDKQFIQDEKHQQKIEKESTKLQIVNCSTSKQPISQNIAKIFQYNLKKPVKHDLVYVLGRGSKHGNLEIKISITSMLKFCGDWINNIYIVGENPRISNPMVKHIYAPDITKNNKDANIIHKLLTAIESMPKLTDNFLFCADDILVTRRSSWEDFAPRHVFEYNQNDEFRKQLYNESKNNEWDKLLLKTMDRFIGYREHIYFYEPHIFAPINKHYFSQMCKQIDYMNSRNVIIMTLWFNWLNLKEPQLRFDHQSVFSEKSAMNSVIESRHLTYNDSAFKVKEFRDKLIELVTMDELN